MRGAAVLLLLLAAAVPARAGCPAPPDRGGERAALLAALAGAPDPAHAQRAAAALWRFWFAAPDPVADRLLMRGEERMGAGDYRAAEVFFAELVRWCPAYAEGWNRRAFARFLRGDLDGSLADIAETLAREPAHFGALSGKVQILLRQRRLEEMQAVIRRALEINPWAPERALLLPGEPI
jgi:tetratricopeptide (TPR) repeat protein